MLILYYLVVLEGVVYFDIALHYCIIRLISVQLYILYVCVIF